MTDPVKSRHNLPRLQFLPQEKTKELLAAHGVQQDIVVKADEDVKEFLTTVECPECHSHVIPFVNPHKPFTEGKLTPNFLCRCASCDCEIEPYSGVITKEGQDRHYDDPGDPYPKLTS